MADDFKRAREIQAAFNPANARRLAASLMAASHAAREAGAKLNALGGAVARMDMTLPRSLRASADDPVFGGHDIDPPRDERRSRLRTIECPSCKMQVRVGVNDRISLPEDCANCEEIARGREARREASRVRWIERSKEVASIESRAWYRRMNTRGDMTQEQLIAIQNAVRMSWLSKLHLVSQRFEFRQRLADGNEYTIAIEPIFNPTDHVARDCRVRISLVAGSTRAAAPTIREPDIRYEDDDYDSEYDTVDGIFAGGGLVQRMPQRQEPKRTSPPRRNVVKPIDIRDRKITLEDE